MPPLILGAFVLWYSLAYRLLTLRRGSKRSLPTLIGRAHAGTLMPARGAICQAVDIAVRTSRESDENLRRRLDDALGPITSELSRFGATVRAIVVAAPLAGLLGTVAGMIETFDGLAEMTLFSQSGGVAGGISVALVSTQTGLAVALPGLLVGRVLARKQHSLETEVERLKRYLTGAVEEHV